MATDPNPLADAERALAEHDAPRCGATMWDGGACFRRAGHPDRHERIRDEHEECVDVEILRTALAECHRLAGEVEALRAALRSTP